MSKERLEEIKERFENLQGDLMRDEFDWLIEQAERVQGLLDQTGHNFEVLRKLDSQNKRYRERLEYLLSEAKDHGEKGLRIQHWALIKDLENALEETE